MRRRLLLVLGTFALITSLLSGSASADPETGKGRRSDPLASPGSTIDGAMLVETADDGHSMVVFNRPRLDDNCGRARARVEKRDGSWVHRSRTRVVNSWTQALLTAGKRIAWVGIRCTVDGPIQLRYGSRKLWNRPVNLSGPYDDDFAVGMNATGLVALARPVADSILVDTARPRTRWTGLPPIATAGRTVIVDHVGVTKDEQIFVVWHDDASVVVSTLADGTWGDEPIGDSARTTAVHAGSNARGVALIAINHDASGTDVAFRDADRQVTSPELLTQEENANVAVAVLPHGNAVAAWHGTDWYTLGRRAVETGEWSFEFVTTTANPYARDPGLDIHQDGSIVLNKFWSTELWTCTFTSPCEVTDYPKTVEDASFAAGPGGSIVGLGGDQHCDDWCWFDVLRGYRYQPE